MGTRQGTSAPARRNATRRSRVDGPVSMFLRPAYAYTPSADGHRQSTAGDLRTTSLSRTYLLRTRSSSDGASRIAFSRQRPSRCSALNTELSLYGLVILSKRAGFSPLSRDFMEAAGIRTRGTFLPTCPQLALLKRRHRPAPCPTAARGWTMRPVVDRGVRRRHSRARARA